MTNILFSPLSTHHLSVLHKWMQEPHINHWYGDGRSWSFEDIKEKYTSYTLGYRIEKGEKKLISSFVVELEGNPIGLIQYYNALDFQKDGFEVKEIYQDQKYSIGVVDFYIGEPIKGEIEEKVLKTFLKQHVFSHFDACIVDLDKNNKVALKLYSKAGFSTFKDLEYSVIMIAKKVQTINPLIILGSSRSDGNTLQAVKAVFQGNTVPIVDLNDLDISYYDYSYANANDDFIALAEKMVRHNPIILATPVYWYTMSALMKTFLDRWSDLLDIRKDIGKRLTNKELYVITSYAADMPKGFEDAFSQTCEYLDMRYRGCFYFYCGESSERLEENNILGKKFSDQFLASASLLH